MTPTPDGNSRVCQLVPNPHQLRHGFPLFLIRIARAMESLQRHKASLG